MKSKSHSGNAALTDTTTIIRSSPLKFQLVMLGGLVALLLYWFYFILGGTFDPVKRASLKKTMPSTQKLLSSSTQKTAKTVLRNKAAPMHPKNAAKQYGSVQKR